MSLFSRKARPAPATQEQDDTMLVTYLTTSCAWCNEEAGIPQGDGSHGICDEHAEQVRQQAAESRQRRREARQW